MPGGYTGWMVVLGMGNACLDTLLRVEGWPQPGGKQAVGEPLCRVGGQVAGAMVGCVRLGLAAQMLLRTGDDAAGRRVWEELGAAGVGLKYARVVAGAATASATILRDGGGERSVLWSTDVQLAVRPEEIVEEMLAGVDALLLDGRDGAACLRAAQRARARGIPVVGDLDEGYAHTAELLEWVDHLVAPESFAPVQEAGNAVVVVTMGAQGARGRERGGGWVASPGFKVDVVDTTGAGDAFHAGYLYALLEGWGLRERLRFANATAALACTGVGALAGLPTRAQVEALLAAGAP